MTPSFDHVGLAVRDLGVARRRWEEALGVISSDPEVVPTQKVRVSFLSTGPGHLELLEPTEPGSPVARYLDRRGEGIHHVAYRVPDLARHLDELRRKGVRLVDETPRPGARGRRVAFAHPQSFFGVLTEFVEGPPGEGTP
jgi:methylmalonyl-CoA epimerase